MTMARTLRIFRRLFDISLGMSIAYRAEMAMFMMMAIGQPVISLLIWRAAISSGAETPMDSRQLTTYFVLLTFVNLMTSRWFAEFLAEEIRLGDLNRWLIRPGSTFLNGVANNLAEKAIKAVALVPMVAVIWFFFRDSISLPHNPLRWGCFLISVVLASVLAFVTHVLLGILAFWIDDVAGPVWAYDLCEMVLSGMIVPLALFPEGLLPILHVQPFRYIASFPLEIMVGDLSHADLWSGLVTQVGYVALAIGGAVWLWRRGLRTYAAMGG